MANPSNPNSEGSKSPRRFAVADDAKSLFTAVDSALHESESQVERWMRDQPLLTIGAAAGVGYLLGGGLTPRIAARLFSIGGRMVLAATLERWLVEQLGLSKETIARFTEETRKEVRR